MRFTVAAPGAPSPSVPRKRTSLAPLRPSSSTWYRVTADGDWALERSEDDSTSWTVAHLPEKTIVAEFLVSLRECRAYVASGAAKADLDKILTGKAA